MALPLSFFYFAAALCLTGLPKKLRPYFVVTTTFIGMICLLFVRRDLHITFSFWHHSIDFVNIGPMSLAFSWIFALTAFLWSIYSWHLKGRLERVSGLMLAGAGIGIVQTQNWLALLLHWEMLALAGGGVIIAAASSAAINAALRYILVHIISGTSLMFGILWLYNSTGTLDITSLHLNGVGNWLIFFGLAINCAVVPLSGWLTDAYPQATPSGLVMLSAYTTKAAVYVLALTFAGSELLLLGGLAMMIFGIVYAFNEDDSRKFLCYILINQIGIMVCGIGLGTPLALNGVAIFAFCGILYKHLLFMGTGVVLHQYGETRFSQLGGLAKSLPLVFYAIIIGAMSLLALPFTSGFISKSVIIEAAHQAHRPTIFYLLIIGAMGAAFLAGFALLGSLFFGPIKGTLNINKTPTHMLIAMGLVALLATVFGCFPDLLNPILPNPRIYQPYNWLHLNESLQLALGLVIAYLWVNPFMTSRPTTLVDTDLLYRLPSNFFITNIREPLRQRLDDISDFVHDSLPALLSKNFYMPIAERLASPSASFLSIKYAVGMLSGFILVAYVLSLI